MARFFHYVLFIFAAVAVMELSVEAAVCSREIGACAESCDDICRSKYPEGGKGACQDDNCVCFFECGIEKRCNVGLGRCSSQCSESCCAAKCAQKGPLGQGYCDGSLVLRYGVSFHLYPTGIGVCLSILCLSILCPVLECVSPSCVSPSL